jgi:hypothetical protein
MINPIYPMSSLSASAGTHMPTPHPIVGTGLFPEIPLFMTYVVEKKYGFVDEYFMIHLKHLSNSKKWEAKNDTCYIYRSEMKDELYQIEDELLGKNEDNLVEILGKPDKQDLHKRGQKQYTYYLHCMEKGDIDLTEKIIIRLNALNRVTGIEYNF